MSQLFAEKRVVFVDIIRILSIVAVIILHYTADVLTRTNDFDTTSWWVSNLFNSVARFAVPVFFMISGAMVLRSEIKSYKQFYMKRVLPLVVSLVSWSLIYAVYTQYVVQQSTAGIGKFFVRFGYGLLSDTNYIHLWFLYAIIAIYMTVPLVSKLVRACSERDIRYYLILWFAISILYRFASDLTFRLTGQALSTPIANIPLFMGYLGYFILGYYLYNYSLAPKTRSLFFNLGIVSFFLTPVLTYFASQYNGALDEMFYGNYSLTTFFMAMAVFLFFQHKEEAIQSRVNAKVKKLIGSLSKASFSIYLIHLLVEIMVSRRADIEGSLLPMFLNLVFNVLIIFAVSYVVVKVLNLNKFITQVLFGGKG